MRDTLCIGLVAPVKKPLHVQRKENRERPASSFILNNAARPVSCTRIFNIERVAIVCSIDGIGFGLGTWFLHCPNCS